MGAENNLIRDFERENNILLDAEKQIKREEREKKIEMEIQQILMLFWLLKILNFYGIYILRYYRFRERKFDIDIMKVLSEEDKKNFLEWSEGNKYLYELLCLCWENEIRTFASCGGHEEEKNRPYLGMIIDNNSLPVIKSILAQVQDMQIYNKNMDFYKENIQENELQMNIKSMKIKILLQ